MDLTLEHHSDVQRVPAESAVISVPEVEANWFPAGGYVFVPTKTAAIHARMEAAFGLPEPTSGYEEVFGPYQFEGKEVFWRYDRCDAAWYVMEARQPVADETLWFDGLSRPELSGLIDILRRLPTPPLPSKPCHFSGEVTFVFKRWILGWSFDVQGHRWGLTRRDRFSNRI